MKRKQKLRGASLWLSYGEKENQKHGQIHFLLSVTSNMRRTRHTSGGEEEGVGAADSPAYLFFPPFSLSCGRLNLKRNHQGTFIHAPTPAPATYSRQDEWIGEIPLNTINLPQPAALNISVCIDV